MHIPRNRFSVATGLAAVMFLVTACAGGGTPAQSADPTPRASQSSEAIASPTTTSAIPATTPPMIMPTTPTALPQFGRLQKASVYHPGTAPSSQMQSGTPNVPAYLQAVMRSNRDVWRETLTANGLTAPSLTYDVTSRSDRYVSACTRNGQAIVVTPDYGRMFYCSEDNKPFGAIALPTDAIANIWGKTNKKTADLAGAITVSRTSALILTASLQQQLGLPTPEPTSRQYVAACLSGTWAHSVYAQNTFTEKELAVALEYAYKIGSEVDGQVVWIDPTDLLITAWVVGFRGGKVSDCGTAYWR